MPGARNNRPSWLRYSGMGMEFAAAVAGMAAVGYWIGTYYDRGRGGLLLGALLGIVGGGYNMIRASLAAIQDVERHKANKGNSKNE